MPRHTVQAAVGKSTQDTPSPAPSARRKRVVSVLRASWGILRHLRPMPSHRPPEMHAIDHLAKDHTKAFV